jgi:hypothetical protein
MFATNESRGCAGYMSSGAATIDSTRKVLLLMGAGDCGGFGACTGLQLAQDP